MMRLIFLIIILGFYIFQTMVIDENVLDQNFSDLFKDSEYVKINMSNFEGQGLASYDYCSTEQMAGQYHFMGFSVHKLAVKVDDNKKLKEVMLKLKIPDSKRFYEEIVENYGMPDNLSLSKFYLEKHGFDIPPKIAPDSITSYYENVPQPRIDDFPDVQNLSWYDLNKNTGNIMTNMLVRNKSNPANKFIDYEVWVVFKRAK